MQVDPCQSTFGDVRLQDLRLDQEDLAELTNELESFWKGGTVEGGDEVLIGLEVSDLFLFC